VKILEIMERVNSRDTNLVIAYIKDAINLLNSNNELFLRTKKLNIVKNTRDYNLPADLVSLKSISVLDTEDDNKYKQIRRLSGEPIISEDTNP
tara:strand:+ start:1604 stop:1882 length:279 start_codon:yes stop_codon:yes gene_type:complete